MSNISKGLTFNDVHCKTLNLVLLKSSRPLLPENKDTYVEIPHKDSSILVADNSVRDINVEVEFLLKTPASSTVYKQARNIAQWLATTERKRLIFDDDPEYYYNAKVTGNIDLEKVIEWGTFTVNFRCEPYPKVVSG